MSEQKTVNILHVYNPKSPHVDGNPWYRACEDGEAWFRATYGDKTPTVEDVWRDLQDEAYEWSSWFACVLLDISRMPFVSLDSIWQRIQEAGWADALVICEEVTDD